MLAPTGPASAWATTEQLTSTSVTHLVSTISGTRDHPAAETGGPVAHAAHSTPGIHPPHKCFFGYCLPSCITVFNVTNHSVSSSSVVYSWSTKSLISNATPTVTFKYGTSTFHETSIGAVTGRWTTTLTGLAQNTVYYYTIEASQVCGVTTWFGFGLGCFLLSSTTLHACPFAQLSIQNVTVSTNPSGTQATIHWTISPGTLIPAGNSPQVEVCAASTCQWTTSPAIFPGLTPFTTYAYQIIATATAYATAYYPSQSTRAYFNTDCVPTEVRGVVTAYGPTSGNGVYGAEVFDSGTFVTKTAPDGSYTVAYACSAHNYKLTVRALGFYTVGLTPISGTAPANQNTTGVNFNLPFNATSDGGKYVWDGNNNTYTISNYQQSNWTNVTSATVSYVSGGTIGGGAPSGASQVLEITGTDTSSPKYPDAHAAWDLGATNGPFGVTSQDPSLSSPLYLSFNVFWASYGTFASVNGHFAVDAILSNGAGLQNTLDSVSDSNGNQIMSSLGNLCYAGANQSAPGQWTTVYCDLTELRYWDIGHLLLVYDNGNVSSPGIFNGYIDGIRLILPTVGTAISNGGFEVGNEAYGWFQFHGSNISIVNSGTGYVNNGSQAVRLGSTSATGDSGSFNRLWQVFRVPNNNQNNFKVGLSLYYRSAIGSGGSVDAYVYDHFTGLDFYVVPLGSGSTSGWTHSALNVTNLEGHIVSLYLEVSAAPLSTAYAYIDDIQVRLQAAGFSEQGVSGGFGSNSGTIHLPKSVYQLTCGTGYVNQLADAFGSTSYVKTPYVSGLHSATIINNVSLGVSLWNYDENCQPAGYDNVTFGIDYAANSTGTPKTAPGYIGILNSCIEWTYTYTGTSYGAPAAPVVVGSENLNGSGYPVWLSRGGASLEDSAAELAFGIFAEYILVSFGITFAYPLLILESLTFAFALLTDFARSLPGQAPPCKGVTNSIQSGVSFDAAGYPATQAALEAVMAINVGTPLIQGSPTGTYTVTLTSITQFCYIVNYFNCLYFDQATTTTALTIDTT